LDIRKVAITAPSILAQKHKFADEKFVVAFEISFIISYVSFSVTPEDSIKA